MKEFKTPTKFGQTECFRVVLSVRPISVSIPKLCHLRMEIDLVSTALFISEYWTFDKAPEARNSTCKIIWHFNVYGFVHCNNIPVYISNKMQRYTVYFIWKQLYMFRVVPPPIVRSAYNCIYSIWYLSDRYCYLPL